MQLIRFLEAYPRLLAPSTRSTLIRFFVVGVVRGLHCVHLHASTAYDNIGRTHEISPVNGATDTLSISPSAWYIMFLVIVTILLLFTVYVTSHIHIHIPVVKYIKLIL
jgi:hypothetical protein